VKSLSDQELWKLLCVFLIFSILRQGGMLDVEYFCSRSKNPYNYAVCCM